MTPCPCGQCGKPAEYVAVVKAWSWNGQPTSEGPWYACGACARAADDRGDLPKTARVFRLPPAPPPRLPIAALRMAREASGEARGSVRAKASKDAPEGGHASANGGGGHAYTKAMSGATKRRGKR
jgi:hypothetical protein